MARNKMTRDSPPIDEEDSFDADLPVGANEADVTDEPATTEPSPKPATAEVPRGTIVPRKPARPAKDPKPPKTEDEEVGAGGTLDDLRMAFRRNTGWIGTIGDFIGGVFHYFFVGCASLLGVAVILLIPIFIAAAVTILLGLPGYLVFRWFGQPEDPAAVVGWRDVLSPLTVLVTIFWSGYFVTHGWPHLSEGLSRVFTWIKPALVWMGRVLENLSEDDDDEE